MLLEGSNIDNAAHENDVVGALSEMEDFEKGVQAALDFAKKIKKRWLLLQLITLQAGSLTAQRE